MDPLTRVGGVKRERESLDWGREDEPLSKRINNLHLDSSNQQQQYSQMQLQQMMVNQHHHYNVIPDEDQEMVSAPPEVYNNHKQFSHIQSQQQLSNPTNQHSIPVISTPPLTNSDNSSDSSDSLRFQNQSNHLQYNHSQEAHYTDINRILHDLHFDRLRRMEKRVLQ